MIWEVHFLAASWEVDRKEKGPGRGVGRVLVIVVIAVRSVLVDLIGFARG